MADFSTDIQQFVKNGTYEYQFDPVGNLIFNSSSADFSQVYLSLPLTNVMYNNTKIQSFYDPNFQEFIPATGSADTAANVSDLQSQLNTINQENVGLKSQLDNLIAQMGTSNNASDSQVVKQVILELRKALGQGSVDANFSDVFPYIPLVNRNKPEKI